MHYYIDGYNLLFRLVSKQGLLQRQRELLIADFGEKLQWIHFDMTIVFDATYQQGGRTRSHYRNLEIIYTSKGETADEFILSELAHSSNPRNETVITSDKKLASQARMLQAKTESVEQFHQQMNHLHAKKKKAPLPPKPEKKTLPIPKVETTKQHNEDFYLEVFEKHFQELESKIPSHYVPPVSEFQRWLSLFEEKLRQE